MYGIQNKRCLGHEIKSGEGHLAQSMMVTCYKSTSGRDNDGSSSIVSRENKSRQDQRSLSGASISIVATKPGTIHRYCPHHHLPVPCPSKVHVYRSKTVPYFG